MMMMMNIMTPPRCVLPLVLSFMAMSSNSSTVTAFLHDGHYQEYLPGCAQAENFVDAARCAVKFSSPLCFDMSTPKDLYECFQDEWEEKKNNQDEESNGEGGDSGVVGQNNVMKDVLDAAADCFDPYYDCMVEQVNAAIDNLPACVRDSTTALANCFIDNVNECAMSCLTGSGSQQWDSPFANLNIWDLFSCRGIGGNVVQPMCDVISCCPPCIDPLEEVAECVVNDLLDFGFWGTCDFDCQVKESTRILRAAPATSGTARSYYTTTDTPAEQVYEACRSKVPGLFGSNDPSDQLAARSDFFDCIMDKSMNLYTEVVVTDSPTMAPTTPAPSAAEGDESSEEEENVVTTPLTTNDASSTSAAVGAMNGGVGIFLAVVGGGAMLIISAALA